MSLSYHLVVAIDFGTTYSGYAYSFKSNKINVKTVNKWSNKLVSQKTPTSILLDSKRNFHSFGYDAEDNYAKYFEEEKAGNWFLFRRVKMCLYDHKNLSDLIEIMDVTKSVNMQAIKIFIMAIRFLKDHALKTVNDPANTGNEGRNLDEKNTLFVLTVPAIWDNRARAFMRKAAVRAGIPETNLQLALESEAASIWCQTLPFMSEGAKYDLSTEGSKYMVVDIGGGTADITVHETQSDRRLRELHHAIGGDWGGTKVDEAFVQMLEGVMGEQVIARFKTECIVDFLDLLKGIEVDKRTAGPYSEANLRLCLPQSLCNISREVNQGIPETNTLRIDAKKVREMFAYCVDNVISSIHDILKDPNVGEVGTILVVGGFSESLVVNNALRKAFQGASIIIPPEPGLSIMKGGVLYGHEPGIIASRIASFTYGLEYADVFDEKNTRTNIVNVSMGNVCVPNYFKFLSRKDHQ